MCDAFYGLFAAYQSQVLRAKAYADLIREVIGRCAAGKNPHKVIGNHLARALHIEDN